MKPQHNVVLTIPILKASRSMLPVVHCVRPSSLAKIFSQLNAEFLLNRISIFKYCAQNSEEQFHVVFGNSFWQSHTRSCTIVGLASLVYSVLSSAQVASSISTISPLEKEIHLVYQPLMTVRWNLVSGSSSMYYLLQYSIKQDRSCSCKAHVLTESCSASSTNFF